MKMHTIAGGEGGFDCWFAGDKVKGPEQYKENIVWAS